jgi:hypothetical protein
MGIYTSAELIPLVYVHFAIIVVPGVITGAYTWWTGFRDDENQVYSDEIDVDLTEESPLRTAA